MLSALLRESNAAAAAVASSAATDFLNESSASSTGEEVEISKFRPLTGEQPRMTSSPGPGRTGSRSRSSSPTQRRRKRISRSVKVDSQDWYAELSSEDISISGDEEYEP